MAKSANKAKDIFCKYCALESQGIEINSSDDDEEFRIQELVMDKTNGKKTETMKYLCRKHLNMFYKKSRSNRGFDMSLNVKIGSGNENFKHDIRRMAGRRPRSKSAENIQHQVKKESASQYIKDSYSRMQNTIVNDQNQGTDKEKESLPSPCGPFECGCEGFHKHAVSTPEFCVTYSDDISASKLEATLKCMDNLAGLNEKHLNICNTFWYPALSMSSYRCRDDKIEFESLWQRGVALRDILRDGVQNTALRAALEEMTILSVSCGPSELLLSLLDLGLVRLESMQECGAGLLHYACLFRQTPLISALIQSGIPPNSKDRNGDFADQCCFCPQLRKQLPQKYLHQQGITIATKHLSLQPSVQDQDAIFRMASSPNDIYFLQKKLQMFEFNVNTECNGDGDFLIHIATAGGLCQLPLLTSLIRLQSADIELCNSSGMTPLMIAAMEGSSIMCDVMMCIFGADPNKCNVHTGKNALHYAVMNNHVNVISCLIKRGADVNREDYNGCRPDDQTHFLGNQSDCLDIISSARKQRAQKLSSMVLESSINAIEVLETDLHVTNDDDFTLLMLAAKANRVENVRILLEVSIETIDAQYFETFDHHGNDDVSTGMTALAMAAKMGHFQVVEELMRMQANPNIKDINGLTPLQLAVQQNHQQVVNTMLEFFPAAYSGLHTAMKMCMNTAIHQRLKEAWSRRQEEIVSLAMLECCLYGKAEELYCVLEEGDKIDIKTGNGNWPLYLAVENGHLEVVKLLCERGADIRKRKVPSGVTVLHGAAKTGNSEIMDYLLELCRPLGPTCLPSQYSHYHRGLDVNATNSDGKTALQVAGEKGYIRIVRSLLLHGASTSLLDHTGQLFTLSEYGGVWNEIEAHRKRHTNLIFNFINQKSKKSFMALIKIWLPGFDHNLRNHHGDTPLMVASKLNREDLLQFMLQSAVYPQSTEEDDDCISTFSDSDSGVLDATTGYYRPPSSYRDDDLLRGFEFSRDYGRDLLMSGNHGRMGTEQAGLSSLESFLQDVEKPRGLSIYHDGLVSHVCAQNSIDGCCALHRCLQGGDNPRIAKLLIEADPSCINMQSLSGLTPLHLGCELGRRKSVEVLLATEGIDLNILTLEGKLPEEMAKNKGLVKCVQTARKGQPVRLRQSFCDSTSTLNSLSDFNAMSPPSTNKASTVNFDKVQMRFEAMKRQRKD